MCRIYSKRALTLIELTITIALISVLLAAVWLVYNAGLKAFYAQAARGGITGEAGRALVSISRELRQATAVINAQQTTITFTADTDDNGLDETIQYVWSGVAGDPLNKISAVTSRAIGSVNNLAFSYYDASNNLLVFPVSASSVRLVAVDLVAADGNETIQLRSSIRLRNL